jgi:hypothetical protein
MLHSIVTCHECAEQTLLWVVEFPPQGVICCNCGQAFKFAKDAANGGAHLQIVPYRYDFSI